MNKRALGCLAGLLAGVSLQASAAPQEVHFANWADYIGPTVLADFQKETGIKVVLDAFESDEVLEAKLLTGHSGFDVVVPSADFLARQLKAGVYRPLDEAQLPNRKNLDPALLARLAQSDPGNRYAVPYLWGTVGVGYNPAKVKAALGADAPLDSWDLVFKPENLAKLKGCGVAFLDSPAKIIPLALHCLGKDPNSNNPADYEAGAKLLESLKPSVTYFSSTKYIADLANGDVCVAIGFSGDVLQAQKTAREAGAKVDVEYSVPKEGTNIWFDNLAVPKDAKNPEGAQAFINYLMRPDVIARTSDYLHYANANLPAKALMDPKVRDNPAVYPDAQLVKSMYVSLPPAPAILRLITRDWSRIKSGV
ncbi:polyamine ABC transporter substrate-binding protein [Pseudomonas citronellolis]|uniref:polyamine ABC transporter substrate-binding protein n=1 Tax=Pseudomonas citronellolis TaxID=53408 RepID=UPI003D3512F6